MEQSHDQQEQAPVQQETVAEALTLQAKVIPAASPTSTEETSASAPTSEAASSATDTQGLVRELASRLGEESGQIVVHRDLSTLLDRMKDGVVVQLSVSRPRFFKKLGLEDLGLKIKETFHQFIHGLSIRKAFADVQVARHHG